MKDPFVGMIPVARGCVLARREPVATRSARPKLAVIDPPHF